MNYILLKEFHGRPHIKFIGEACHTSSYDTYFYCVKLEDEIKIPEIKALELLNTSHNHVLESVPWASYWTVNKLVQLLQTKEDSCFILYADTDYERAWGRYSHTFLDDRDIQPYSIIRVDP